MPGRTEDSIPVRVRVSEEGESIAPNPDTLGAPKPDIKRRARITREDIVRIGYTINCPGCKAISRNAPAQNHTELCRKRIEAALISEGGVRAKKVAEGRERYAPVAPPAKRQHTVVESDSGVSSESSKSAVVQQPADERVCSKSFEFVVPHNPKRSAEDIEQDSQENT